MNLHHVYSWRYHYPVALVLAPHGMQSHCLTVSDANVWCQCSSAHTSLHMVLSPHCIYGNYPTAFRTLGSG